MSDLDVSPVEQRWQVLCKNSDQSTEHCSGKECFNGSKVDVCCCDCSACQLSNELLLQAQEELGV